MTLSTEELISAREAASAILDELRLDAYIFEVEPQKAHYEIKVECACETDGGWASITLTVPQEQMLSGFNDTKLKQKLFQYWNKKLAPCKRKQAKG
jgi:hypothetical protein